IRFNLLAMVRDLRARARELGDAEGAAREERKREAWCWENALRRHNFLGFVGEVVKEVARRKVMEGEGRFEAWVAESVERTRRRVVDGED
ncbi:MAG: hypothetical protein LQ340_008098, partial [Diploschistes diacapsis]